MQQKILETIKAHKEITTKQLAQKLGTERHTIAKYCEILKSEGLIAQKTYGRTKIWSKIEAPAITLLQKDNKLAQSFQNLLSNLNEHIHIIDKDKNILYSNKEQGKFSKKQLSEAKSCHELIKGQTNQCYNCPAEKTFKTGAKHTGINTHISPQGKQHVFEVQASPIKNEQGDTVAVMEVIKEL